MIEIKRGRGKKVKVYTRCLSPETLFQIEIFWK